MAARRAGRGVVAALVVALALSAGVLAINWGEPDDDGHPNVGAILVDHPERGPFNFCSGTLIAPDVYLTAAHCAVALNQRIAAGAFSISDVYVSFDPYDPAGTPSSWHPVTAVTAHPLYGHDNARAYDLAVAILAQPIQDIVPAQLPEAGYLDALKAAGAFQGGVKASQFTVVGYGSRLEWPPPQIYSGTDRRVATSGYLALTQGWLYLSQNHAVGNGGTGFGDSGGPTFWSDPTLGDVLVSTTTWGDVQTVATGVTQRLDVPQALSFLAEFLQ